MNKKLHRIVFNKKRGQLIAVAENAGAQGKSASGERCGPVASSFLAALTGVLLLAQPLAQAQVVADPSAPGAQRPTVLNAPNGVPLVNIQTPSAAGVSRNTYSQFDVQRNGVILNNSRSNVQTQLGGWSQGNPWLATGAARVIVNEVNSANPSLLKGFVEVAGQKADVVIANPAGIKADGGGFINAGNVVLTTGTPQWDSNGSLDSYRVQRGTFVVEGLGLDTRSASSTQIMARAAQINAGLWANYLGITLGANDVSASDPTSVTPQTGTGVRPAFSLDVAAIGGMYAGHIRLIGTEAGLGFNNTGAFAASEGALVLTVDGKLINTGIVRAAGNVEITTAGGLANSGSIYAGGSVTLSSRGEVSNSGLIGAQGNTTVQVTGSAAGGGGQISSATGSVVGARLNADGSMGASGNLAIISDGAMALNGQTAAGGDVAISGTQLDLTSGQLSAQNLRLAASSGGIDASRATLSAQGNLQASASQTLLTDGASVFASQLSLAARDMSNEHGHISQTTSLAATFAITGTLNNAGGTINGNGDIALTPQALINQGGTLQAAGTGNLLIATTGTLDNSAGGQIAAGGSVSLGAANLNNAQGRIMAGAHLNASVAQTLDNTAGLIASNADLTLTASRVNNTGGTIASVQAGLRITTSEVTVNDAGKLQAALDVTLANAGLSNSVARVTSPAGSTQQSGNINGRNITITTGGQELNNRQGAIISSGTLSLTTGGLNNAGGYIGATGALTASTADVANTQGGQIASAGNVTFTAGGFDNQGGQVQAVGDVMIVAGAGVGAGAINNTASLIRANGHVTLTAASVLNSNTSAASQGVEGSDIAINADRIANDSGAIRAGNNASLVSSAQIDNAAGLISAANALTVTDAQSGTSPARSLAVINTGGISIAGVSSVLDAASLTGDGQWLSKGNMRIALASDFSNSAGLVANGDAQLSIAGQLVNSGKLQAGGTLTVSANTINNTASGEISAATTRLTAADTLNNRGLIDGHDTQLNALTVNNLGTGRIYGDHLSIQAGTLNNLAEGANAPVIAARERLDLGVGTLNNREHALIFSAGDLAIGGALDASRRATGSAQAINNASASIEALGNLTITSQALNNTNEHFSSTAQQGVTVQVIQHAEVGSALRYDASQVMLCDLTQCVPGTDVAWLGRHDSRMLLLPSVEFPFDRLASYYLSFPSFSSDSVDPACYDPNLGFSCGRPAFGAWYASSNPIWAAFGVAAPTAPEPPLAPDNGCRLIGAGGAQCVVGATTYNTTILDITYSNSLPHPITQAEQKAWADWSAWQQAFLDTHAALDARLIAFNQSFAGRKRQSWDFWNYSSTAYGSVLATTDPARIVSGSSMTIALGGVGGASGIGTNDMSQILAGGALAVTGAALNNTSAQAPSRQVQTGVQVHTYKTACLNCNDDDRAQDTVPYNITVTGVVPLALGITQGNTGQVPQGAGAAALGPKADAGVNPASAAGANTSLRAPAIVQVNASDATTGTGTGNGTAGGPAVIRTIAFSGTILTGNSLFITPPNPSANYFVETDPRFASYTQWLSSDYLLAALGIKPADIAKRLGDGFIEQRIVREQVAQLTGQRFLANYTGDNYTSDDQEYTALMNAGVTYAKAWSLRPGVALTAQQMAQLTSDIVWLVEQDVTLADGSTVRALVPQVYARVQQGDLTAGGALLSGDTVAIHAAGDLTNSGSILGRQLVTLTAENVQNLSGLISGHSVAVNARADLNNIGGQIAAISSLTATAGRDLKVETTTAESASAGSNSARTRTSIDRIAGLYVTGAGGTLAASAGRDINLLGAVVSNAAADSATVKPDGTAGGTSGSTTTLTAGNNINLGTVTTKATDSATWNATNSRTETSSADVGSVVRSSGSVSMKAGNDLSATAATVQADGALTITAERDVEITQGANTQSLDEAHRYVDSGFFSTTTKTTRNQIQQAGSTGSALGGATVEVNAGRDIAIKGSSVVGDSDVTLKAGRNVTVEAATNTGSEDHLKAEKKSGLFGSGGLGITLGTREQSGASRTTSSNAAASTIGSVNGNVVIRAGNTYTQTGSDVTSPGGNVDIKGQQVFITEARETTSTQREQKFKQSGLTVAVTSPVISAVQTVAQMASAAGKTSDGRMQALTAASGAMAVNTGLNAIEAGKGSVINGKPDQIATGKDTSGNPTGRDATEADKVGGVNVSISLGSSSSQSKRSTESNTARGSSVAASGNVSIQATGAGESSNVIVQGSTVTAGKTIDLQADNKVQLLAAKNTASQTSSDKSSSGSIGVSLGTSGFGVTASASQGRGSADGTDVSYTNTRIQGNKVSTQSGGDTDIKGAVVKADSVTTQVGGNLNIESLQDTSTYKESSKSIGGSVTVGAGVSGSISAGKTNIDSNYASVQEQSGIRTGDGGFQVDVEGRTDLKGGAITSTQKAIDAGANAFSSPGGVTTSDIRNSASYSANSVGVNMGTGVSLDGKLTPQGTSAGIGSDKGSSASTTQAAISGSAGDKAARTGNAEVGIRPIFDQQKVKDEVNAQVAITAEFGRQAPKAWADYSLRRIEDLKKDIKAAQDAGDSAKAKELFNEAKKWGESGAYRVAGHVALAAAAGGANGAAGALSSAAIMPTLGGIVDATDLPTPVKQGLSMVASATLGAIVGGTTGAASAFNVEVNNRQLHSAEKQLISKLASGKAKDSCSGNAQCETKSTTYWTDLLENAALGLVDDTASTANQKYLAEVKNTTGLPGTEGAMGAAAKYLDDYKTALGLLAGNAGQVIVVNGQPTISKGSAQTYFSATDQQKADAKDNVNFFNPQGSIIPNVDARDASRLDTLRTQNGAAQPVYPVEELLLGGAVGGRLATLAGRALGELDTLLRGSRKPIAPGLGSNGGTAGELTGTRTVTSSADDAATIRSLTRENESATTLANNGYKVQQNPPALPNGKKPDYIINGQVFDNYAPSTSSVRNAWSEIDKKVARGQADNVVVNLADTPITPIALKEQLTNYPIAGLKQVIIIDKSGTPTAVKLGGN
jgi:filamentous hemagglutinin